MKNGRNTAVLHGRFIPPFICYCVNESSGFKRVKALVDYRFSSWKTAVFLHKYQYARQWIFGRLLLFFAINETITADRVVDKILKLIYRILLLYLLSYLIIYQA